MSVTLNGVKRGFQCLAIALLLSSLLVDDADAGASLVGRSFGVGVRSAISSSALMKKLHRAGDLSASRSARRGCSRSSTSTSGCYSSRSSPRDSKRAQRPQSSPARSGHKHRHGVFSADSVYDDDGDEEENGDEGNDDDDDLSVVESAFFRATSPQDTLWLREVHPAHMRFRLQKRRRVETELDHLESLKLPWLPCSVRKTLQSAPTRSVRSETEASAIQETDPLVVVGGGGNNTLTKTTTTRGGRVGAAAAAAAAATTTTLPFWENMVSGAISRSVAQTIMHPANTMKTMLQNPGSPGIVELIKPRYFRRLTLGAGANFLLSVPHGAVNFAVLEFVRQKLGDLVESKPRLAKRADRLGPGLDFMSSAISTITCSVVSTPQMMITDNIMAGNYNGLSSAVRGLAARDGLRGFYLGWWPGLVGKIPSYALTWTIFQQLKRARDRLSPDRPATNVENSIMGCIASGTTVTIMIPMDTIKTRLVTQSLAAGKVPYRGIIDCGLRVLKEEGVQAFYRGLPPRLVSVVPMIGIQFGVYEFMKRALLQRRAAVLASSRDKGSRKQPPSSSSAVADTEQQYDSEAAFEEAAMEVAASPEQPYPAPHFHQRVTGNGSEKKNSKSKNRGKSKVKAQ